MGNGRDPVKPKAYLLNMTDAPLRALAAAAELYHGRVVRYKYDLDKKTCMRWFDDMTQTKLAAPLEFVNFHFLLEGVSRAFTHQLVRQRTAVYVQESMRFAVKENAAFEVAMPAFIAGLREDDPRRKLWQDHVGDMAERYTQLINSGVPAEDARGILPTNITTRVHYATNLRNLADHAGNRLCTQAQFEWRLVWAEIISAIRVQGFDYADPWEIEAICSLFRPVCFQTGRCGFDSSADRTCSIRPRVKAHEAAGERPDTWNDIADWEWLADPTAAR
jgi:flavin-dependent thymidylate synthase